ncbi:hypothetical protein ATCC90586_007599 [Pythium insidiosum]|nr:hypothetical protein ATCC90586_007599 [Pythium insidiosum]
MRHWAWRERRVFQPFDGGAWWQFAFEDRTHQYEMLWPLLTYFGEKHAFYYAFLLFYSTWLLPVALVGAACQLAASVPWLYARLAFVSPLFAVVVALWATLVVERWKRKRSEIQANFGNFTRNRNERSPTFYGDFLVLSPESPTVDHIFPHSLQIVRIYVGLPLLLTMAGLAVALFVAVKLASSSRAVLRRVVPWLPPDVASYVIPVINAVCMLVLDNIYTKAAVALTVWENHRTVWQYESMLAVKLFGFKFLNAFISLFWVAFVDRDDVALRKQLIIIMGARQLWYAFKRHVVALLHVQHKWRRAGFSLSPSASPSASPSPCGKASGPTAAPPLAPRRRGPFSLSVEWYAVAELDADTPHAPPPIVRLQEEMYPPDFLLDKQMEVVLQFGYITMFVSVLPVAPLLALLGNVVFTRLDVICSTQVKRRPPFESETEVSTFMSILSFMSFAGVAVNCAVLFFTTRADVETLLALVIKAVWRQSSALSAASPENYIARLWVLLFLEHAVLAVKAFVSLALDDSASWVQYDEGRQDKDAVSIKAHGERAQAALNRRLSEPAAPGDESPQPPEEPQPPPEEPWRPATAPLSAFQRALTDKYAAAVLEKNQALERESRLAQRLAECLREMEQLKADASASRAVAVAAEPSDMPTGAAVSPSESSPACVSPKGCVLCGLLSQAPQQPGAKRCLTCKRVFCAACDDLVHFDDLGVREDRHFRVSLPSAAASTAHATPPRPATEPADSAHRPRAGEKPPDLADMEQLLRSLADAPLALALAPWADVRLRVARASAQDQALALRYLRNAVRRHKRRLGEGSGRQSQKENGESSCS